MIVKILLSHCLIINCCEALQITCEMTRTSGHQYFASDDLRLVEFVNKVRFISSSNLLNDLFKLFDGNNGYHKTQNMSKAALKFDLMMLLVYIPFNTHILSCVLPIK